VPLVVPLGVLPAVGQCSDGHVRHGHMLVPVCHQLAAADGSPPCWLHVVTVSCVGLLQQHVLVATGVAMLEVVMERKCRPVCCSCVTYEHFSGACD
jgi:hypothetical protein